MFWQDFFRPKYGTVLQIISSPSAVARKTESYQKTSMGTNNSSCTKKTLFLEIAREFLHIKKNNMKNRSKTHRLFPAVGQLPIQSEFDMFRSITGWSKLHFFQSFASWFTMLLNPFWLKFPSHFWMVKCQVSTMVSGWIVIIHHLDSSEFLGIATPSRKSL